MKTKRVSLADSARSNTKDYKTTVYLGLAMNKTYDFWVAAVNRIGEGAPSEKVKIIMAKPLRFDLNVKVTAQTNTSVTLRWNKDSKASSFLVTVQDLYMTLEKQVKVNNASTTVKVVGLCPGSQILVMVQSVYGQVLGEAFYSQNHGILTLSGSTPEIRIANLTKLGPTSEIGNYNFTHMEGVIRDFTIYYSTRAADRRTLIHPQTVTTKDSTSFEVYKPYRLF